MPDGQSKMVERTAVDDARRKRQLQLVTLHTTINIAGSIMNFTTRGELLKDIVGGDYAVVGQYLAKWTGATALLEFLLNPTVGKLSDTYGRKPFMMLSPYAALVLKSWVLLQPSIISLSVERIVCDLLRTLSGTTMCMAALADLVPRDQLGLATSSLFRPMGMALIVSPLAASCLSARGSYKAAIVLALVQLYTDRVHLEETLPLDQRREFTGYANPFDLARLFTMSSKLTIASIAMALQNLMDIKILADPMVTLQLSVLQWTREQTQQFSALLGLGLVVGKKITEKSAAAFGKAGHTTFAQCVTIASNLLLGVFPYSHVQVATGFMGWIGDQKGHFVKEIHTTAAMETGRVGKGELSGLQANLRALCIVVGPFIYAWAQRRGMKAGRPGAAFLVVAVIAALSELTHQRLQLVLKH